MNIIIAKYCGLQKFFSSFLLFANNNFQFVDMADERKDSKKSQFDDIPIIWVIGKI